MNGNTSPDQGSYQLKWHKFLIYFGLWAGALINASTAFQYFTGTLYGENASAVYAYFGGMKTLDAIIGVVLLAIAAMGIYVRFQLAGFKTGAPNKLIYLYIANLAIPLLYLLAASSITGISFTELISDPGASLAVSVAMMIINKIYYGKREALFVN